MKLPMKEVYSVVALVEAFLAVISHAAGMAPSDAAILMAPALVWALLAIAEAVEEAADGSE